MNRAIILFCLSVCVQVLFAQPSTQLNTTLSMSPWTDNPVVLSNEIKGGIHWLKDIVDINEINDSIPAGRRQPGMMCIVGNLTYNPSTDLVYQYSGSNWHKVSVLRIWESGQTYQYGQAVYYNGGMYIAIQAVPDTEVDHPATAGSLYWSPVATEKYVDGLVPYVGATTAVNLNAKNLTNVSNLAIGTTATTGTITVEKAVLAGDNYVTHSSMTGTSAGFNYGNYTSVTVAGTSKNTGYKSIVSGGNSNYSFHADAQGSQAYSFYGEKGLLYNASFGLIGTQTTSGKLSVETTLTDKPQNIAGHFSSIGTPWLPVPPLDNVGIYSKAINGTGTNYSFLGVNGIMVNYEDLKIGATLQFHVNGSGNILRINDIPTSFPAAQGAASTFLKNDGAGNLTWAKSLPDQTGNADKVLTTDGTSESWNLIKSENIFDATIATVDIKNNAVTSVKTAVSFASKAANATLLTSEAGVILASNTITLTLPVAATSAGVSYVIKNIGTDIVTIKGDGAELIDGANTSLVSSQFDTQTVACNGTQWYVITKTASVANEPIYIGDANTDGSWRIKRDVQTIASKLTFEKRIAGVWTFMFDIQE